MAQKFHSGNVHNYDSLYTSFRDVSGILDDISNDQLKEKVKDYITKTKKSGDDRIEYRDRSYEDTCKALAKIYGKIICLVCKGKNEENRSHVEIDFYGVHTCLDGKCLYILYDIMNNRFNPLYVAEETNPTEKIKNLSHNDDTKELLRRYICQDLKFCVKKGDKMLDISYDDNANEPSIPMADSKTAEHEIGFVYASGYGNSFQDQAHLSGEYRLLSLNPTTVKTSNKNFNNLQTKHSISESNQTLIKQKEKHRPAINKEVIEGIKYNHQLDNQISKKVINDISKATHEFRCGTASRDGSCYFWSLKDLLPIPDGLSTKELRAITASYIKNDEELSQIAPYSIDKCYSIDDYCFALQCNLFAGEIESKATSALYGKQIIWVLVNDEINESYGKVTPYGNKKLSECIYVQLNTSKQHFEPLYICNKNDPCEVIKILPCNHPTIKALLDIYLEEKRDELRKPAVLKASHDKQKMLWNEEPLFTTVDHRSDMSIVQGKRLSEQAELEKRPNKNFCADKYKNEVFGYLANEDNHRVLKISLNGEYLLSNVKYILNIRIVQNNDENIRPFYRFKIPSLNGIVSYGDQVHIHLEHTVKKIEGSKTLRQIKLELSDLSQKSHDMIQGEQPLLFTFPDENGIVIAKEIDDIHGLSFQLTLCSQQTGEKQIYQHVDMQYIHYIAIENGKSFMDD